MQEFADTLESQLAEKEQLVAALTERLEQAAEQLDRLHRTGADRAMRAGSAGMPAELVEQHQKLVEDLQRAVMQWEDMQPGAFFGRLESQLAEVRELVLNLEGAPQQRHHGHHASEAAVHGHGESNGPPRSNESVLHFLKSESNPGSSNAAETNSALHEAEEILPPGSVGAALPPLQPPPVSLDMAAAERAELADACEARDSYILYLMERLRKIELIGYAPNSWSGLENAPDEVRSRLTELERRLEETLRIAEVELSLQRAKLGREEARIRGLDEQVQKEQRRARNSSMFAEDVGSEIAGPEGKGSRWRRMLGRRTNDNG